MPAVSIIIPLYNQSRYVKEAIQSALDQTFRDFEVIVVDDGSTDASPEVVAEFGDQVCYLRQENQGLAGARNTGIRVARGDLVGLLDADDQWSPKYLESMVTLAKEFPEAAVYYCQASCMDIDGLDLPQILGGPPVARDNIYWRLLRANFIIPSTVLLRKSLILEAGMFDAGLRSCEDWDLWLRLLPENKIIGSPERLVRYRIHGNSLSTNVQGMQQAVQAVIEKNFGEDDGRIEGWSLEKRRAYGGVYRYSVLTNIQRNNDWESGSKYLREALKRDPTLAQDLSLFYDLALGNQPIGYRGSNTQLDIDKNTKSLSHMLNRIFNTSADPELQLLRRETYGTAYYALGLVAYNTKHKTMSRRFFINALLHRPDLWRDKLVVGNLIKSFFSHEFLEKIKRL